MRKIKKEKNLTIPMVASRAKTANSMSIARFTHKAKWKTGIDICIDIDADIALDVGIVHGFDMHTDIRPDIAIDVGIGTSAYGYLHNASISILISPLTSVSTKVPISILMLMSILGSSSYRHRS